MSSRFTVNSTGISDKDTDKVRNTRRILISGRCGAHNSNNFRNPETCPSAKCARLRHWDVVRGRDERWRLTLHRNRIETRREKELGFTYAYPVFFFVFINRLNSVPVYYSETVRLYKINYPSVSGCSFRE